MQILVTGPIRNEGTIIVLEGVDEEGNTVHFAADHRPAQDILDALSVEDAEDVYADVPDWAILATFPTEQP